MLLRSKVVLIIFMVLAIGAGFDYFIKRQVILPRFVELEDSKAKTNIDRCVQAIESEKEHLSTFLADWSSWDDTYAFMSTKSPDYITSNLGLTTFKDALLNVIYICDVSGRVVWGKAYDRSQQQIQLKELPADIVPSDHPAISCCHGKDLDDCEGMVGIMTTERGPMLVATKPILTSQKKGPSRGFMIMGRFLDEAMNKKLADQTKVDFTVSPIENSSGAATGVILKHIAQTLSPYICRIDEKQLEIYTTVADIGGMPAILLRANLPRDIYQRGLSAMEYTRFSSVLINISVLITLMVWLQIAVIGPLLKLTSHTEKIAQSDNLTTRLNMKRKDEIGSLAKGFDFMLEKLSKARAELMERSYKWGKAEMASGVLHNLRNSLSPVVARIEFMREDMEKAPLDNIQMAQQQLTQEDTPAQRKADLHRFLELANGNLEGLCRRMKDELEDLAGRTMQIEQMLGDQDILSHTGCPVEPVTIEQLVGNSKKMIPDALCKDIAVEISPDVVKIGDFECDRISVSQIFANLLINAAESIHRGKVSKGRISVDADIEKTDAADMIHIRFADNGGGIASQDAGRIFERGFTTKQQKELSGIGLHWCANTVGAMGGKMWAQSDGVGLGACLHLVLPLHPQKCPGKEKIRE